MEPDFYNWSAVLNGTPAELQQTIPKVVQKIAAENLDRFFVRQYVTTIHNDFHEHFAENGENYGWTHLQKACVELGMIDAFMHLMQDEATTQLQEEQFHIFRALSYLVWSASHEQKRSIAPILHSSGVFDVCLERVQRCRWLAHRYSASELMFSMMAETFLPKILTPEKTADVVEVCCLIALSPTPEANEFAQQALSWQMMVLRGLSRFQSIPDILASIYCVRLYGKMKENCMIAAKSLLVRSPPPSPQFVVDMLRYKPTIIDQLLECYAPIPLGRCGRCFGPL